jgi:hypothetical protein
MPRYNTAKLTGSYDDEDDNSGAYEQGAEDEDVTYSRPARQRRQGFSSRIGTGAGRVVGHLPTGTGAGADAYSLEVAGYLDENENEYDTTVPVQAHSLVPVSRNYRNRGYEQGHGHGHGRGRGGELAVYVPPIAEDYSNPNSNPNGATNTTAPMQPGHKRGFLWRYIYELGRNYDAVLRMSLIFQVVLALLLAFASREVLPGISELARLGGGANGTTSAGAAAGTSVSNFEWSSVVGWGLSFVAAFVVAVIIQFLLIVELGQIVWQRRLERLRVQMLQKSFWWWMMLGGLAVTCLMDILIIFLSFTGRRDLGGAWQVATNNNFTILMAILVCALSFLTALRCAFVMNTTSLDEVRAEIRSELDTLALEVFLDVNDHVRDLSRQALSQANIDLSSFVPLSGRELEQLLASFTDLLPKVWLENAITSVGYDFGGNRLVAVPPETHTKLENERRRAQLGQGVMSRNPNYREPQIVPYIKRNIVERGKPIAIEITDPELGPVTYRRPLQRPAPSAPAPVSGSTPTRPASAAASGVGGAGAGARSSVAQARGRPRTAAASSASTRKTISGSGIAGSSRSTNNNSNPTPTSARPTPKPRHSATLPFADGYGNEYDEDGDRERADNYGVGEDGGGEEEQAAGLHLQNLKPVERANFERFLQARYNVTPSAALHLPPVQIHRYYNLFVNQQRERQPETSL